MKVCFESDKTSFLSTVLWKLRKNNVNCHTLTILLYHLFTENNKIMEWEKRRFFVKVPALPYQVISKEVENRIFRHNHTFRQICMCTTPIDNKVVELYFCANIYSYFRYIGSLSWMIFLLLIVILSGLHEKPRRKDWVPKKST